MITVDRVTALRRVDLFSAVPSNILAFVAAAATELSMQEGEILMRQGEPGDRLFVIVSGLLHTSVNEHKLAELGPGSVVGEFAVLVPESRSATVTALEVTALLCVDKTAMDELLLDYPAVASGIITALVRRFQQYNQTLASPGSP